ncbi:hypothetical protein BGX23_008423 [Mortierella sp. AD031]|nr:hypothetical protein BGX23_008423 [Mortierella sp. AD031]
MVLQMMASRSHRSPSPQEATEAANHSHGALLAIQYGGSSLSTQEQEKEQNALTNSLDYYPEGRDTITTTTSITTSTTATNKRPLSLYGNFNPHKRMLVDDCDIEAAIRKLKEQRIDEHRQAVYIPPQAKANLQASEKESFSLMDKVKEFLDSPRQVFLVLGDSGAGKSTFNRHLEQELLKAYKQGDPIPLFINLPAIDIPQQDMIGKQLRIHNISDTDVMELKEHYRFIIICDGYDETQIKINLHATNLLNQKGQWDTKMVISCRSTYLGQDYRDQFQPQWVDRYTSTPMDLYSEAAIVPFSRAQIKDYVEQFVRDPEVHLLFDERPVWSTEEYMDRLQAIPNLMELVKNPFLLTLSLKALPADASDLAKVRLTRLSLYDMFINQWLEINKQRLRSIKLSVETQRALDDLLDEGFQTIAVGFLKDLAAAIFKEQDGNPVVQYTHRSDKGTWKVKFFGPESDIVLLRDSSPLARTGVLYQFIHRSLLEYFFARQIYEADASKDLVDHPFMQRNLVKEPSIVQFLSECVLEDLLFKQRLFDIINQSKTNIQTSQAAANAMTILVRADVRCNGMDFRGIRVPGADLI